MTDTNVDEWLCLSEADKIYVDHKNLMQHQIDALRFLYAEFKKKKAGVIFNDPSGYGKTVVVVLFLHAIKKLLPAPALVLCRAAELQHWRRHFHCWGAADDIIVESSNPYVNKSVFVNTRQQLAALARRSWSVVVLEDELAGELQADYKIYLTNEDMKENLSTFSTIYKWLYPKEEFDINFFTADKTNPIDVDKKSVLVRFFFEDLVFRSKKIEPPPFTKPEINQTPIVIEPPRISRKNKDATGTKIKRSKARIEAENHAAKVPRLEPPERNETITSKEYFKDKEMDVESFIRNEKPITGEGVEAFMDLHNTRSDTDITDKVHGMKDNLNGDAVTVQDENAVCTADYQDAINDIINNENDKEKDVNIEIDGDTGKDSKGADIVSFDKVIESSEKTETILVVNETKKDLDTKISELEEKTLNKFKGSLLDSIF